MKMRRKIQLPLDSTFEINFYSFNFTEKIWKHKRFLDYYKMTLLLTLKFYISVTPHPPTTLKLLEFYDE